MWLAGWLAGSVTAGRPASQPASQVGSAARAATAIPAEYEYEQRRVCWLHRRDGGTGGADIALHGTRSALRAICGFGKPALVGKSNYTHFGCHSPFRVAALNPSPLMVGMALHGDSGKGVSHQNIRKTSFECGRRENGTGWSPVSEPLRANALLRLDHQPWHGGKSRSGALLRLLAMGRWCLIRHPGRDECVAGVATVHGLPPVAGNLVLMPGATRLPNGSGSRSRLTQHRRGLCGEPTWSEQTGGSLLLYRLRPRDEG